jgi:hypothetical protein
VLTNLFAGLFRKRCPLCKQEVPGQGNIAVQRLGKWFCCELHAELYEMGLYEALRTVYWGHAAYHGEHVPLPEAVGMNFLHGQGPEQACVEGRHGGCFHR